MNTNDQRATEQAMTAGAERLYEERDLYALGNDYIKHTQHMTSEALHSKSDIAAELAVRDIQIRQQAAQIERLKEEISKLQAARIESIADGLKANTLLRLAMDTLCKAIGSIGAFTSDEGSSQNDFDNMDTCIAVHAAIKLHLGEQL